MVMSRYLRVVLLHAVIFAALILPAQAALYSVSGLQGGEPPGLSEVSADENPAQVAVNLANGFPLWYQDEDGGLKLQLCLDTVLTVAQGVVVNPCEYEPPTLAPPSFPGNFGAEAAYWTAAAFGNYVSSNNVNNSALLVLSLEATGANETALNDGNQAVGSTIRLRIDVPVAGTYQVTHPYGTMNFNVATPGGRAIDVTQSFGLDTAQNFLTAMNDDGPPVVNAGGATIGPFLVPTNAFDPLTLTDGPITVGDATYIALPFAPPVPAAPTEPVEIFQPVTGSLFVPEGEDDPANYFRIELLDPPADFFLNQNDSTQLVQFDNFLLVGKVFNDLANVAPVAFDDAAATTVGRSVNIDVVINDIDVAGDGNAHGINPQALALVDALSGLVYTFDSGMPQLTATQPTAADGSVRRVTNIATGKTTFFYTPPSADFAGPDSFQYVVQDHGGLISAPATVNITVENLQIDRADYRPRFGKWHLTGTSSDSTDNFVTLYAGPRAQLTPEQEVQTPSVTSTARGNVSLLLSDNVIEIGRAHV